MKDPTLKLGFSIFIQYGELMKKSQLKQIRENEELREGLVDIILKKIADKKIKANKKDMMDILKGIYGSEDKIPDWRKDRLGL